MANIMIAGLPNAGKSTYIGALAYTLKHSNDNIYKMFKLPDDSKRISELYNPWLSQEWVRRTARGDGAIVKLNIQKDDNAIELSIPNFAGEIFEDLLKNYGEELASWPAKSDGLLFFINNMPSEVLADSFNNQSTENQEPLVKFEIGRISVQIMNLLLLKELCNRFNFNRIAICISAWDKRGDGLIPKEYLKQYFPVFYNYLNYYYPESLVFGISAQGAEYSEDNREELEKKTKEGTRAYIVQSHEKVYDLTIPIDFLMN